MQEKILELLKRQAYIPADEICRHLGISRQPLWQHIHELRQVGYDIVAVPHAGYHLLSTPDRLFPFEIERSLSTRLIGRRIHYVQRCSSTMDIAMELARSNAVEGTVVVAETQTKGRGRMGRQWLSPKYKGIYFSVILRPRVCPSEATILTLLAAVAVCEAIRKNTGLAPQIKWPNDIFLYNKKLGGILTEFKAETDTVSVVTLGIGINVNNNTHELLPSSISLKTACDSSEDLNRIQLFRDILRALEDNYLLFTKKSGAPIVEKWKASNLTLGKKVRVVMGAQHVEGRAVDIDKDGGLLIRRDSGKTEKFVAGDVVHLR